MNLPGRRAALLLALLFAPTARAATIVDPGQGPVTLAPGSAGAKELSGLAYVAGNQYYGVSDAGGLLYQLEIEVDGTSGHILSRSVVSSLALSSGNDLEGLVHSRPGGSVLASDEVGPAIRHHRLSDGALLGTVAVPAIFSQIRPNFSLESLSLRVAANPADGALWTANEEALLVDGPLSTSSAGTIVRLQRYDDTLTPDGQWAYVTDPYPGGPFLNQQRSGVADLLALENGELLVLERSFSDQLFRARIYQVDLSGATDTSTLTSLATDPFTPVTKILLWQVAGVLQNYEGLAVGPALAAGDRSLLLVADDGAAGGAQQVLYPLRLPEPGAMLQLAAGVLALGFLRRCARASLAASASALPSERPHPESQEGERLHGHRR
jgi:hypothetical protein